MQNNFQGRGRVKNVSFRGEPNDGDLYENPQRNSRRGRGVNQRDEPDELRMVKLLPDANMTISVPNDYMNSRSYRGRGNRGILKSHNFRDDTNFNYNYDRNNNNSNRGFDPLNSRGRGRGRPRGFFHSQNQDQEYDNYPENNQGSYRSRPLSGGYEYEYDNNSRNYRDRASSGSYEQGHENHHQDQSYSQRNNRPRQSSGNYESEYDGNKDQSAGNRNFRGRSQSANDWSRRGRGGRAGRGRGRTMRDNDDIDAPACGDGDKRRPEDHVPGNKNDSEESRTDCPPAQGPPEAEADAANGEECSEDARCEESCGKQSPEADRGADEAS